MKQLFTFCLILVLATSCSFNKMFLAPYKIPANTTKLRKINRESKDTVYIYYSGPSYQPTFLHNKQDTIQTNYTIESVVFTSSNGHKLNGWMVKPKNSSPTTTLLHIHGNAGNLLYQYQAMTPLIEYNYQVFVFDYSGFGFSEGKATKKNVLTDALSAVDYVRSREDVKNTKLVLYGQSLGGHASATVAAKKQDMIDGLVIEGAFSSHKDIAAYTMKKALHMAFIGRMFTKDGYNAKRSLKEYKKPVLIIHSTEDETIPFYMGQKLFDTANEKKEFYEIKKCHICGPGYYPKEISEKINNMIK
ncbi:MAG TPA: alpha/beta hydrolase [Bacteroidia bacterium]